mgnify:CR=1 FL=1
MASISQNFYDQLSFAQKALAQIKPDKISTYVRIWFMAVTAMIIPILAGFEFTLAFSIMDMLFGAELPSDPVPFNVWMLSGSAIIAVIAMHVFIERHPNHIAIKMIDKAAPFALLLFFIGMIALYATMDFQTVQAGSGAVLGDDVIFGEVDPVLTPQESPSYNWLNILIGLGLGGLILVNVSVMHRLISHVRDRLPPLLEKHSQLRAITLSAKKIISGTKVMIETARDIERRGSISAEDHALETSADIEAAVAPTMRKLSVLSRIYKSIRPGGGHTLDTVEDVLPHGTPPAPEIDAFIGDMEERLTKLPSRLVKLYR